MSQQTLARFIAIIVFSIPILACGAVGVYNPEATQVAMEGTVVALQATISALEDNINQSQNEPQIVVVTATSTATPTSTPQTIADESTVVAASSLGQTIELTSTPTPTPITITSQDTVVTVVATFTPSPTPKRYDEAPIISEPVEGTIVEEGKEILLQWSWNGLLGPNERYDIKVRPDGRDRSAYVAWERGTAHNFKADIAPGRYYWSVQVIRGTYKDGIVEPENRIFESYLSPESEPRLIIIAAKEEKKKTPTPTPTPVP